MCMHTRSIIHYNVYCAHPNRLLITFNLIIIMLIGFTHIRFTPSNQMEYIIDHRANAKVNRDFFIAYLFHTGKHQYSMYPHDINVI